jgi:DNA-binding LacI/PurR family transcriptional regulator
LASIRRRFRALRDLETDGLLRIVPRKGTFVAHSPETKIELLTITRNVEEMGPTSHRVLAGMQEAHRPGETVMGATLATPPFPDAEKFVQELQARRVAGLVVFGYGYFSYPESLYEASFIHTLAEKVPLVLAGKPHDLLELDAVYCDPRPQLRSSLEGCYEQGARRFGYLASISRTTHFCERMEAFR